MDSFLNSALAAESLIHQDRWAEGHGVIERNGFLGTSLLYFTFAYMLPAKTAVILGSGAGFVPRMVRQAQKEVPDEAFVKASRCILIDACIDDKGFGYPEYHEDPSHFFRTSFPDIEIWRMTTEEGAQKLKKEGLAIDFLHIDADHTFKQSLNDFESYLPLMSPDFIMTLHDTAIHHLEGLHDGCVPRTVAYLRKEIQPGGKYENLEMLNFNHRHRQETNYFKDEMRCRGVAVVKPKQCSIWETELGNSNWLNSIMKETLSPT